MTNKHKSKKSFYQNKNVISFVIRLSIVILLLYWMPKMEQHSDAQKLLYNFCKGMLTTLIASLVVSTGGFFLENIYQRNHGLAVNQQNVMLGISRIGSIINGLFIIIGVMLFLNIDPKEFLTSITLVAMALALTFREYITNMISGLFIMFSQRFKLGDVIKSGEHKGAIIDITLANIVLRSDEDQLIFIPNNNAFTVVFQNLSNLDSPLHFVHFSIPYHIDIDLQKTLMMIKESLQPYQTMLLIDETSLQLVQLKQDEKKYRIKFYLRHKGEDFKKKLDYQMMEIINSALVYRQENIPIKD